MNVSLLESLRITFIEIIIPLFLSAVIGIFLGWICTKNYRITKIFKVVFRLLVYSIATLPTIFLQLYPYIIKYRFLRLLYFYVVLYSLLSTQLSVLNKLDKIRISGT
jgi:ABC-type microcin C transport system permease subunit YejE